MRNCSIFFWKSCYSITCGMLRRKKGNRVISTNGIIINDRDSEAVGMLHIFEVLKASCGHLHKMGGQV